MSNFKTSAGRLRSSRNWKKKHNHNVKNVRGGIKVYFEVMRTYYTRGFRKLVYKQLRKDFEKIQRMRIAA